MAAVGDLSQMRAQLRPRRHPGRYVFATVTEVPAGVRPVMTFTEDEGLTVIGTQAAPARSARAGPAQGAPAGPGRTEMPW